jgi:hypothetical protein
MFIHVAVNGSIKLCLHWQSLLQIHLRLCTAIMPRSSCRGHPSKEVNCTEPCYSVRVLWFDQQVIGAKLDDRSKLWDGS